MAYLGVFELGSLVCALAPTSNALIAGRAVAGFGASGVFAGGFVLLTTIIPLHKRAIWTGTMSSTFAIASIVGPVIAGAFTEHITWRWCFYLNLPIGGFAAVLILFLFRIKGAATEKARLLEKIKGLDGLGFVLFAGSITMLLLALQFGGTAYAWKSSVVIGLFVGFGVTLLAFIPWQLSLQDTALIPPKLFKNRNASLIFSSSIFVNGPFQTIVYWLPIWFQAVLGVNPEASGIRYLPTVISDALSSMIGAGIVMQLGIWNPFLLFAEVMVCIGGGLLTTIHPGISDGHWIGYQIFGGIGYSLASNLVGPIIVVLRTQSNLVSSYRLTSACRRLFHKTSFQSEPQLCCSESRPVAPSFYLLAKVFSTAACPRIFLRSFRQTLLAKSCQSAQRM